MRKKIAAGNWKMNLSLREAEDLVRDITRGEVPAGVEIILAAPYPFLTEVESKTRSFPNIHPAAQDCYHEKNGAYTGGVSADMLQSIGVPYTLIGHSERRIYHGETDEILYRKVNLALDASLIPIFCCGESLDVRKNGNHIDFVLGQLDKTVLLLEEQDFRELILAYEPVWAIGTGETASAEQANEMHAAIRGRIAARYGHEAANRTPILYGGSVKPSNAAELFAQADVDGGLIGGASLKASDFLAIANAFNP